MRVVEIEGAVILSPAANLDMENSKEFKEQACKWCDRSRKGLIMDLRDVVYIDSLGLGSIVSVFSRCVSQRKKTVLVLEEGNVKRAIYMTKLDKLMDIFDSVSEALKSLG